MYLSLNEHFHEVRRLSHLRAVKFTRITRSKYQASEWDKMAININLSNVSREG